MNNLETLLIGGKPYAGKSTLAEEFVGANKDLDVAHLSIGNRLRDIYRGEVKSAHAVEISAGVEKLKKDASLPYGVLNNVFEEFCTTNPTGLLVVDNYPAYYETFEGFKKTIQKVGAKVVAFCRLEVDDEIVFKRIEQRKQRWNEVVENRPFVERRLDDYRRLIEPTLEELAATYPTHVLDGNFPIHENAQRLKEIYLESKGTQ